MRKFAFSLALVGLFAFTGAALAEIGTIDDVPGATLLLPYFEVDLSSSSGITTLFSINNASAAAAIAHVTLWTDQSIPTFDFDIYLTGYDVQTINVRDIFTLGDAVGVPRTAERTIDAGFSDTLSPSPPLGATQAPLTNPDVGPFTPGSPTEWDFPGSSGPCAVPYNAGDNIPSSIVTNLVLAHTGQAATIGGDSGVCFGFDHGDNTVRGYITIDNVVACNLSFPSDTAYAATLLSNRNQLWGDYFYVNDGQNFAQGETLVHIEACASTTPGLGSGPSVGIPGGNATVLCPFDFAAGDYTFYGRYFTVAGQDQREPLATTFATRYLNGGAFSGGTDLIVWRDSKTIPTGANGPFNCALAGPPGWFPLNQNDVVGFDEQENPENLCFTSSDFSPPGGGEQTCLPLEAGRYDVATGNAASVPIAPTAPFGWLYLNLNTTQAGVPFNGFNQAWVTTQMDAQGRFSVGFDAIKLDTASNPTNIFFIP